MRLRLRTVPRRPAWPGGAIVAVVVWLCLVQLQAWYAPGVPTCPFKQATGVPCPACGLTRGVTKVKSGDLLGALAYNPLVMTALAVAVLLIVLRLAAGRAVRLDATRRERRWLFGVVIVAVVANWAYVIGYVG